MKNHKLYNCKYKNDIEYNNKYYNNNTILDI